MSDVVDWSDPCAVLPLMRERYYALVGGQAVRELRHNGKVVVNAQTKAADLEKAIRELDAACERKKCPGIRQRHARRAGFRPW